MVPTKPKIAFLMQDKLIDKTVIAMIDFLLEPIEAKRPDMQMVCEHPYFPSVLREVENEVQQALLQKQRQQFITIMLRFI